MARRRPTGGSSPLLLLLTLLLFMASGCIVCWAGVIFMDPYGPFNPFPPPTLPPTVTPIYTPTLPLATLPPVATATATLTPTATFAPTATVSPSPTPRPSPTWTATPTPGITPAPPTATATATSVPSPTPGQYPYRPQRGSPVNVSAQNFGLPCAWMGVVGQVLDATGKPVPAPFFVLIQGVMPDGQPVRLVGYAGTASDIGEVEGLSSGFIIRITDAPFNSSGQFTVQLFDLTTGQPLSEPIPFDTYADCERNAVLVNFVQQP